MAILYGTTADGDSLPVEVNEFGQLIAQGLQGQPGAEGPPGPPGIGQLPPDPFEGAFLGWQDGGLAWLGGSVPVPPGTFGPILNYSAGVIELEESPSLVYGESIFMSDSQGNAAQAVAVSPLITAVYNSTPNGVINQRNNSIIYNGKGANSGIYPISRENSMQFNCQAANQFDLNLDYPCIVTCYFSCSGTSAMAYIRGSTTGQTIQIAQEANEVPTAFTFDGLESGVNCQTNPSNPKQNQWFCQWMWNGFPVRSTDPAGLVSVSFPPGSDLSAFSVGMALNGGNTVVWVSPNGDGMQMTGGDYVVGDRVLSAVYEGAGSVQSVIGNSIVLREDNEQWVPGYYVTAPSQQIAIRNVAITKTQKRIKGLS